MTTRSSTRRRNPGRPAPSGRSGRSRPTSTWLVGLGVVVAVAAALGLALAIAGGDDDDGDSGGATEAAAPVTVEGQPLPPLPESGDDPAIGSSFPTLEGTDLDGEPMTIATNGRPTMILFLAHWCPHCQAEVPVVQDWVDGGGLPEGVDLVSVSTDVDDSRPNYPPADWLESEGWTAPVLDDVDNAAAQAAGLTAYPFFVAVDGDGTVVARTSGELTPAQLDDLAATLAA